MSHTTTPEPARRSLDRRRPRRAGRRARSSSAVPCRSTRRRPSRRTRSTITRATDPLVHPGDLDCLLVLRDHVRRPSGCCRPSSPNCCRRRELGGAPPARVCDYCQSPLPPGGGGRPADPAEDAVPGLLLPRVPDGRRDRRRRRARHGAARGHAHPARPVDLLHDERHGVHDGPLDDRRLRGRRPASRLLPLDARPVPLRGPALLAARPLPAGPSRCSRTRWRSLRRGIFSTDALLWRWASAASFAVLVRSRSSRGDGPIYFEVGCVDPGDDHARPMARGDRRAEGDLGARSPRQADARPPSAASGPDGGRGDCPARASRGAATCSGSWPGERIPADGRVVAELGPGRRAAADRGEPAGPQGAG